MEEKSLRSLKIDPQFRGLIFPLPREAYARLEKNILSDGCRDPLTTWKGVIIDGHSRYEICMRRQIPFHIKEMDFFCREEAVAWICAGQLGRRDIPEETRRYLIGKRYEAVKTAAMIKNPWSHDRYPPSPPDPKGPNPAQNSRHQTASRIARENRLSHGTVEKYAVYSRAIDALSEKDPELASGILSGRYKLSHKNVVELSKLAAAGAAQGEKPPPSVKDMPAFDPDADINALALTVPSWADSINRVRAKTDLSVISAGARDRLIKEMRSLTRRIEELLEAIKED